MFDLNSLNAAKTQLKKELTEFSNKPFRTFKSEAEVKDVFIGLFAKAMKLGNYSYDPTTGELAWHIGREHEIDIFARLDDKDDRLVANIVREVLEADGWSKVILLPPVTGSNRILVKMQSDEIKSGVVTGVAKLEKKLIIKKK